MVRGKQHPHHHCTFHFLVLVSASGLFGGGKCEQANLKYGDVRQRQLRPSLPDCFSSLVAPA
jgi:hypothetical protein